LETKKDGHLKREGGKLKQDRPKTPPPPILVALALKNHTGTKKTRNGEGRLVRARYGKRGTQCTTATTTGTRPTGKKLVTTPNGQKCGGKMNTEEKEKRQAL